MGHGEFEIQSEVLTSSGIYRAQKGPSPQPSAWVTGGAGEGEERGEAEGVGKSEDSNKKPRAGSAPESEQQPICLFESVSPRKHSTCRVGGAFCLLV